MSFIDELSMDEKQLQIKRWINRLDDVAVSYEAKWGIGFLQKNCTPDFKTKWDRQSQKLNDAIQNQNLPLIAELVEGTIRAWAAMEQNVVDAGIYQQHVEAWDCKIDDFHVRICKNHSDARNMAEKGVVVFSLPEVTRMISSHFSAIYGAKRAISGATLTGINEPFDFSKGDDVKMD